MPPPVSPIVMAKNEKATVSANNNKNSKSVASTSITPNASTTTATSTTSITPNTTAAATTTGWRRPSISSTEASSSASSTTLPQRKVPTLFPEISALEAKLLTPIPEPFADFPRLPGMKPAPPLPKKLSLISDEASWLDGDEVDYSQQLFTDSVGLWSEQRSERSEMEQKNMTGDSVIAKRMIEECRIEEHKYTEQSKQHTEQLKQPGPSSKQSVDSASQSPRKIVILKRPKEEAVVEAPKVETKPVQEPIAPVVRSFKTAKAREKEAMVVKGEVKQTYTILKETPEQSQPQSKPVQKKIVYSSKEKTKIVIEK